MASYFGPLQLGVCCSGGDNKMKRFHLLIIMVVILFPTYTQAKGSSYPRATPIPIPIVVSLVNPAPPSSRDDQRHFSGDCGGVCRSRGFRRSKASSQ